MNRPGNGLSIGRTSVPLESASKLGHLCTGDDPLVQEMLRGFQEPTPDPREKPEAGLSRLELESVPPLGAVLAVGGSLTSIPNALAPQKVLGYVKIASVHIGTEQVDRLKAPVVNPEAIRHILSTHADTASAVLPIGNVRIPGRTLLQTLRHALLVTFQRVGNGGLYDTLEHLVCCAWDDDAEPWRRGSRNRPHLVCPFCDARAVFPRFRREFNCPACNAELALMDFLGLLNDASEASSDSAVAMNLANVLQHLTLFHFLRQLLRRGRDGAGQVLLLRDGPLMLRGQCARLVEPIRAYLRFLHDSGVSVFLAGVEREGTFPDHRRQMETWFAGTDALFVPDNRYVLERVKHAGGATAVYGRRGLYGSKAFYRVDDHNTLVLSVPNRRNRFDEFTADPVAEDLMGLDRIAATLKSMVSRHFPGVPLPLMAVDRLCDLPQYPSNDILAVMGREGGTAVGADTPAPVADRNGG